MADDDMAAFGASEAACILYPGEDQVAERAAYIEGAASHVPGPKVGDGSGDAAIAIGEDAFKAGWEACRIREEKGQPRWVEDAWSAYDPPEHIKALS